MNGTPTNAMVINDDKTVDSKWALFHAKYPLIDMPPEAWFYASQGGQYQPSDAGWDENRVPDTIKAKYPDYKPVFTKVTEGTTGTAANNAFSTEATIADTDTLATKFQKDPNYWPNNQDITTNLPSNTVESIPFGDDANTAIQQMGLAGSAQNGWINADGVAMKYVSSNSGGTANYVLADKTPVVYTSDETFVVGTWDERTRSLPLSAEHFKQVVDYAKTTGKTVQQIMTEIYNYLGFNSVSDRVRIDFGPVVTRWDEIFDGYKNQTTGSGVGVAIGIGV